MTRGLTRIELSADRKPWDRQENQSVKHHGYLMEYLKLGRGRTLGKLQKTLGKVTLAWIEQLSAHHRWDQIAAAWDAHEDRIWAAEQEEERRKAARERLALSKAALSLVARAFKDHIAPADVTPAAAVQLLTAADRIQRGIFGDTDTTVTMELSGPGGGPVELADFADLPEDARAERAREILARTARRASLIVDYYAGEDTDT